MDDWDREKRQGPQTRSDGRSKERKEIELMKRVGCGSVDLLQWDGERKTDQTRVVRRFQSFIGQAGTGPVMKKSHETEQALYHNTAPTSQPHDRNTTLRFWYLRLYAQLFVRNQPPG